MEAEGFGRHKGGYIGVPISITPDPRAKGEEIFGQLNLWIMLSQCDYKASNSLALEPGFYLIA